MYVVTKVGKPGREGYYIVISGFFYHGFDSFLCMFFDGCMVSILKVFYEVCFGTRIVEIGRAASGHDALNLFNDVCGYVVSLFEIVDNVFDIPIVSSEVTLDKANDKRQIKVVVKGTSKEFGYSIRRNTCSGSII